MLSPFRRAKKPPALVASPQSLPNSITYNYFPQKQPKTRLSSRKSHNSNKTNRIKMKFSYTQTHIINL